VSPFEDLRRRQLRQDLARKARLPEGFYKVGLYLLLHSCNTRSGSKRPCVWKTVQEKFQTEEMVTMDMGDVNGDEVLAASRDPVYQLLRMLNGQKGIDGGQVDSRAIRARISATPAQTRNVGSGIHLPSAPRNPALGIRVAWSLLIC
jgi:hypothetical protein